MKGIAVIPTKKKKPSAVAQANSSTQDAKRTVVFKVSRLTKPWALKRTENIIRALSGSALDGVNIRVQISCRKKQPRC